VNAGWFVERSMEAWSTFVGIVDSFKEAAGPYSTTPWSSQDPSPLSDYRAPGSTGKVVTGSTGVFVPKKPDLINE